jgi:hypothetical protein
MAGKTSKKSAKVAKEAAAKRAAAKPALLAGGNPRIAKAAGDAPEWLSSAARHCVLSLRASPRTRKCDTSTSTRTSSSTKLNSRIG